MCFFSTNTLSQVNEFLKLKPSNTKVTPVLKRKEPSVKIIEASPSKKPKINLVLASPAVQQQAKVQTQSVTTLSPGNTITVGNSANKTQSITLQDLKFLSSGNKCYLPITLKDGSNNDQQVMAQIDTKNLVLPATYLQMKLEPQQITTVDGQQVVQLTSAGNLPTSLSLAQPQYVQTQADGTIQQATILPETRTIFTGGQNITITQSPVQHQQTQQIITTSTLPTEQNATETGNKIQFATLQNVATPNINLPLPETSAITFQRIKVEEDQKLNAKPMPKQQIYKLPTISNSTTTSTPANTILVQTKTQTRKTTAKNHAQQTTTTTTTTAPSSHKIDNKTAANKLDGGGTRSIKIDSNANAANKTNDGNSNVPTCNICEKVFKRKEHLAQHVKLHLGLRPFKCDQPNCNKAFSRKEHLLRHCVSHTGKKQFDCDICHKLFSRKDNLNKHKK